MRKGFWKGLKVIELVIMAAIAAMLLGVVYFRYDSFACRSMQSEAKFSLQEIYAAQKLYHREHDRFASLEKLHIEEGRVALPQKYYVLSDAEAPSKDTFKVIARGVAKTLVEGEIWTIDQKNNLLNQNKVCKH
ncbi:MAG TPA: hypothetical protein VEK06_00255 [Myxococcota bacterium]|nr:hypothetical protein [Myxococcota bacterium]